MTDDTAIDEGRDELRLLIADDDPLVRAALRDAMSQAEGIRIVGEAADGESAVAAAIEHRPDVVMLDFDIPGFDAMTVTRLIRQQAPHVNVVVFSSSDDEELGLQGLQAGAVGFLVKDVPQPALERSLHGILNGEAAVSRSLALKVVEHLRDESQRSSAGPALWSPLTAREWELLELVCSGVSIELVAGQLDLPVETARSDVRQVLAKLRAPLP